MFARAWLTLASIATIAIFATVLHNSFGLRSGGRPDVMLLYVGADDCAPCRAWQDGEGAAFRMSPEFAHLSYREVKSPALFDILKDENWPEDLRGYRDRLDPGTGVPMWFVIAGNEVVSRGVGASQWRDSVLPKLRSLLR